MLGSGAPRGRVLLGRCCCAAASVSRGGGVCRAPGAAAAAALAAAAVVPTRLRQQEQWERRRWYSNDPPSRHLGPVLQVASRPLPLLLPARGLSSSSSPSPGKKEQEEKEGKGGAAHAAPGDQDHHTARAHAHARETVWTTPNLITMSRIAASPLLSWAILAGHYDYAVAGVCVAAATDWLDGYIAKTYNQTSVLGGFLDPLADKVLVAALSIPLAIQGHIPMPLLFVVFGRDALLIAGSFIKRAVNRPEGSPFFDTTTSATFQITPNLLSKTNTVLQFSVLTLALSRALWDMPSADVFEPLCWLTGATTVGSGLTYLVGDGTKVLKRRKAAKAASKAASHQEPPKPPKPPPSA